MIYVLVIRKQNGRVIKSLYSHKIVKLLEGLWLLFSFLSKENNKKANSASFASQR